MKRSFRVVVLAVLAFLLLGPIPNSLARPPGPRLPAGRTAATPKAIEAADDYAAAYGTGTIVHADVLRTGKNALVDVDVAFSGAAMSLGEAADKYTNEVHRVVGPKLAKFGVDKTSYGRGTGLELGIGSDPAPLIGQLSEAAAPDSTKLIHKVVGPIGVPGIVRAELLRSRAQALGRANGCPLGKDGGYGLGSVLNVELLGGLLAATNARPPYREVAQSNSTTRIVAKNGVLGLKSETRQTILPVTFFKGTPLQFTVEVLGEWALRAIAYGNESSLHYGPRNVSPQTPVVRILDAKGGTIALITTQMLLGKKGLEIKIPNVAVLVVGEAPRMVNDVFASDPINEANQVVAAADVVRVQLLNGQLADVRIGHMEAGVTVPSNGLNKLCPGLVVDQTVDKPTVTTDELFNYIVTITNPNECVVEGLKLVEAPTLPAGMKIELVSKTPSPSSEAAGVVTFPALGPLGPGETKTIKVTSKVPLGSAEGLLKALAVATGVCPEEVQPPNDTDGPLTPGSPETSDIPVRGEDSVDGPNVDTCIVPDLTGKTPTQAEQALIEAGCKLGDTTIGPPGPNDEKSKVTDQGTPPGASVPKGTPVDVTIGGPACKVPDLVGTPLIEATDLLDKAGCELGDVTTGTGGPGNPGTIQTQNQPPGAVLPADTKVNVTVVPGGTALLTAASTDCTVPGLIGMTEAEARSKVEAAGCVLVTSPKNTSDPDQLGKVITQNPGANATVPRGSPVRADLGVQVLGATETNPQGTAAPDLARTGGVALGGAGLSLWLLLVGLVIRLASSKRLSRRSRSDIA